MFFQEQDINELLNCQKCKQRFGEPRVLPCGEFICSICLVQLIEQQSETSSAKLKCCYCSKEHAVPEEGFPISKQLEKLLAKEPNKIYRGEMVENFKKLLKSIQIEIKNLDDVLNGGIEKIKDRCSILKYQIQMKAESLVCRINQLSDEMQHEVDEYEIECIESFEKNKEIKEKVKKTISEGKLSYETSNKYLAQFEINEQEVKRLMEKSRQTLYNCKILKRDLREAMFPKKYYEFEENDNPIVSSSIGWIRQKASFLDSAILDDKQRTDLIELCDFDDSSKWSLLYRASRDGRTARAFHFNCDNKAKTLTIVKSTEGDIFGAYTEQAWDSSNQSKLDPNAFIFNFINPSSKPDLLWQWESAKDIKAIFCHSNNGPTFISTDKDKPDLHISFDNDESESYLSWYFPSDVVKKSYYLTSKINFEFAELEVFEYISN
jgi:hypothetical protein